MDDNITNNIALKSETKMIMVRKLRTWFPGAFYHLMHRGVRRPASEDRSSPSKFVLICLLLSSVKVFAIRIKGSFVGIFFD